MFPTTYFATVFASLTFFGFDLRTVAVVLGVNMDTAQKVQTSATESFNPFTLDAACAKRCGIDV